MHFLPQLLSDLSPSETGFIGPGHTPTIITLLTLTATLLLQGESPLYILNQDTRPVIRAIGVSHTACKDEFRQNIRSHRYSVLYFDNIDHTQAIGMFVRVDLQFTSKSKVRQGMQLFWYQHSHRRPWPSLLS